MAPDHAEGRFCRAVGGSERPGRALRLALRPRAVLQSVAEEQQRLQQAVYMGRLTDGQDVADFFMSAPEDAQMNGFKML